MHKTSHARDFFDRLSVEKTGKPMPDLEIFDTFDGATLLRLVHDETFDTDNALPLVLELERVLADYVSDSSLVSNFNKSHTATFYRRLIRFMPGLPDIVVEAPAEERRQLANVLSLLEREDRERSKVGCKPAVVRAEIKSSTRLQCERIRHERIRRASRPR